MPQPTLCINTSNQQLSVRDSSGNLIGTIYPNELYSRLGFTEIAFYSPNGADTGDIEYGVAGSMALAYQDQFANDGAHLGYGQMFKIRRACRIYQGGVFVERIYAGDSIAVDGNSYGDDSTSDYTKPFKLLITAYKKNGDWKESSAELSCDTDIELGYSMGTDVTPYGHWG